MEVTKGKLKNCKTGTEVVFGCNPEQYELSQNYDFAYEPQVGMPAPMVAFRCGGAAAFRVQLFFDTDMGISSEAIHSVRKFFIELNEIDSETMSVSPVEFKMGSTLFRGFVRGYRCTSTRFDPKGEVLSMRVEIELVSDGTYEGVRR